MRGSTLLLILGTALYAAPASADSTACTNAAEQGQKSRAQGKLIDAHRSFLACSATECPAVVAKDCTIWAAEVLAATPTIVIDAKDEAGHDVGDATLTIDGHVIAHQLDGKAISIDPGSHTLDLVASEQTSKHVTQTIIAKEAEKARSIRIVVPASGDAPAAETSSGHTVWPWILVGTGVALVVTGILLVNGNYPENCDPDAPGGAKCIRTEVDPQDSAAAAAADAELKVRQDEASSVQTKKKIGAIMAVAGGAVAVGGLVWFFLEKPKTRAMLTPWFDVASGGLLLRSTF